VTLNAADAADLHRIETYLNDIKTLQAGFEQFNPDGSTSAGDITMSRPGKVRFEYQPPVKMVIISDGDYVAVDDTELKSVQFFPVDSTPVWFLLREGITLSGDVTVTAFERGPKTFRVTAVQTKDPGQGSISLVFADSPLELKSWTILDAQGRATTVALTDARLGGALPDSLFRLPARSTPNRQH
jgi:outer membrane lipoprotein-sorting protein